ncbi:MAG: PIG-L family deacetylase [bacterium]|nr:PIG-L family deacetylase [bacterium]
MGKRILVIAAHPDDEVLGCGGTMARLSKQGHEVFTTILGEGVTSRDVSRQRAKRETEITGLKKQIYESNLILGVNKVFSYDLPDNRFDSVPLLDVVKVVEKVKERVKPDIIFTHYQNDLNIDHQVTYRAVMTATRPMKGETVKEIYAFEVLSSTEWNYPLSFSPDCFYDITGTIQLKLDAMKAYQLELRHYPHPRSLKGIHLAAENWGMRIGAGFAEAFKTVRIVR